MIFRCTTSGDPIAEISFTFDDEGLEEFLLLFSQEHYWWPNGYDEQEDALATQNPQQVNALDIFTDDGSFPALNGYSIIAIMEQNISRLSLIGTEEGYRQYVHIPLQNMLRDGHATTTLPRGPRIIYRIIKQESTVPAGIEPTSAL